MITAFHKAATIAPPPAAVAATLKDQEDPVGHRGRGCDEARPPRAGGDALVEG
eukprot:SAG22_NODE_684_length_7918_cov_6.380356_10_plen_53_part_00